MTNSERWEYYESGALQRIVAVQLLDWAGYWTTAGLDPIEDDLQREQTRQAIKMILEDLSYAVKVVTAMLISDPVIKNGIPGYIPESEIYTAVVSIMASRLVWLTGVTAAE